jgi:glycosyltransferase involved in cell wall biosynthesis
LTASYNSAKTIKATIKSIQNQKMSDIEILIVDDASTDNSLKMIEYLQKQDPRIRIIRNSENKGPLYSKSIGAKYARGKYIMHLDSDDLFINENIFNICYDEAEKNNIDILEFSGFRSKSKLININKKPRIPIYLRFKEHNQYVTQPELSSFIYRKNKDRVIRLIDGFLWGKCIRSEIYRKALDTIGEEIYTQKMFYGDDRLVNFVLFKVANSFKFIKEYGIVYYNTPHSILHSAKKIRNCHDELFNIMSIYNFTKNSSDVVFASFELRSRWKKLIAPGLDEENEKFLKKLIIKMTNCKNLNRRNRRKIYFLWKNRDKT